jgi:hypothetical protein
MDFLEGFTQMGCSKRLCHNQMHLVFVGGLVFFYGSLESLKFLVRQGQVEKV